nr:MAG TPA: Prefoldin subunit 1, Prefoldin subunit/CCT, PFD, CryoEM, Molecular Chaperone.8A [Caudoviricetes sp.]
MEKTPAERLDNLEKSISTLVDRYNKLGNDVSTLIKRVSQLEVALTNMQLSNQTNGPYSGNAFASPFGNPFSYTTVSPIQSVSEIPNQNEVIIQKLDRIIDLFNNNFSRLNWRLEALENQRKE